MYNANFKMDFINYRATTNISVKEKLIPLFEWTAAMEEKLDKDLCNFTLQQILELYKSRLTDSHSFLLNMHSQLSIYAKYCYSKNMIDDGQNHFLEVDKRSLMSCLHSGLVEISLISRKELINLAQNLNNAYEQFIVLGLFEGIMGANYVEFIEAKESDINLKNKTIKLAGGRELSVSTELLSCGIEAAREYTYYDRNGRQRKFTHDEEGWIIKSKANVHGERPKPRLIQLVLAQLENEHGNPIYRTSALRTSGIIDMVGELVKKDNMPSYKECAVKYKEDIIARYGMSAYKRMFWEEEYKKYIDE